jgi:predicted RNA-binding protein associated with RNAse of E/G family
MAADPSAHRRPGEVVALRYITTDARIEMCWACRVVEDRDDLLALFIAAGSPYKAGPKRSARAKRAGPRHDVPPDEYVWRNDTLRLMFPGQRHSVSLFWSDDAAPRRLMKYFVNLEEPFRRTEVGFDTQDHTLDIEVTTDLDWRWRDEAELENHVTEGFYTPALAASVRTEGQAAIDAILKREHPCMQGWPDWRPPPEWVLPTFVGGWDTAACTLWELRRWAYVDASAPTSAARVPSAPRAS